MLLVRICAHRPLLGTQPPGEPDEPTAHDLLAALALPRPRETYRWAIQRGWSAELAGNWAAWCAGLPIYDGEDLPRTAWTPAAIERLLFLRWLVAAGRLAGDTAA